MSGIIGQAIGQRTMSGRLVGAAMGGFSLANGGAGIRSIVQLWMPNLGGVRTFGSVVRWIEVARTTPGIIIVARDSALRTDIQTRADWCEFMDIILTTPPGSVIRTDNGIALPGTMTEIFSTPTMPANTPHRIDGPWRSNDAILSGLSVYPDVDDVGVSVTFAWNEGFTLLGG